MNVFEEVQGNKENYEKYRKPERKVKKEREIRNKVFLGLKLLQHVLPEDSPGPAGASVRQ